MKLTIPHVPPSLNRVLGKHWRIQAGEKDRWILEVRSVLIGGPTRHQKKKRLTITLCHSREYDRDNAYGAVKPLVDALKHWGLIWDDSAEWLDLEVRQEKCSHKVRHTIIELETVSGEGAK